MKPLKQLLWLAALAGGLLASATAQTNNPPTPRADAPPAPQAKASGDEARQKEALPEPEKLSAKAEPAAAQPPATPTQKAVGGLVQETGNAIADKGLRLNFRGVPLDMVLNYLSDAAGFIIVLETEVKGTVDVWSNQPLNKQEAVELLNAVLNKNGYTAIQNGRTLTVVSKDDAKKRDIPVKSGNDPDRIPKNDEIVTQVISVRSLNAVQLVKDLAPLLPSETTLTANEAGNALIMTDTQANIRRLAQIIKALDEGSSSLSGIRVFQLKFADAKAMAAIIKEVFPSADSSSSRNSSSGGDPRAQFFEMMRSRFGGGGRGGPSGDAGPSSGAGGSGSGSGRSAKVAATSDETSNSLIVSAPQDLMPAIESLVKEIDTDDVEDVTQMRVFRLKYADPMEMADLLSNLFPDSTGSSSGSSAADNSRFSYRFGFMGGGGGASRSAGSSSGSESDRMKRKNRVIAVPDRRTASVVVSADKNLMVQIGAMIQELDSNPAKKQKVYVYSLQNADAQGVEQILHSLFDGANSSRNSRTSANQNNNPLTTRAQQNQNYSTTTSGFGSSSIGSGSRGGSGF